MENIDARSSTDKLANGREGEEEEDDDDDEDVEDEGEASLSFDVASTSSNEETTLLRDVEKDLDPDLRENPNFKEALPSA